MNDTCNKTILSSYHSKLSPGRREYREHHHTECEISLFIRGRGTYVVHGKTYPFAAGDVFLFGSNEAHCITEIYEDFDLLNFHFESKLLWENQETVELLNLFAARSRRFSNRFADPDGILRGYLLDLESELCNRPPCCEVRARGLLLCALVHMIRAYDCIDPTRAVSAPSSVTGSLNASMQYINENLEAHLTLQSLADIACMTPTYYSAVFKKLNGVSPWEYITIKRVERAVEMLRSTSLGKLEIAERCGFSSSSNFYKAFQKITGKKPSDYVG